MARQLVLVADGEADIRDLLAVLLTRAGFDTVEAIDGPQALAIADERYPNVVLVDSRLPKLDGFETTQALRARPATSRATIVLLTASPRDGERERALECGADVYLRKPFKPRDLIDKIRELAQAEPGLR